MIVGGKSNKEIAFALDISENTVKTHARNIYDKLGVSDRTSAATTGDQTRPCENRPMSYIDNPLTEYAEQHTSGESEVLQELRQRMLRAL